MTRILAEYIMKIEKYTQVDIGDDVIIWIRNVPYKVYSIPEGGKIFRANTREYVEGSQIMLYKQVLDEHGNNLETPLYDEDDCYFEFSDGNRVKCGND